MARAERIFALRRAAAPAMRLAHIEEATGFFARARGLLGRAALAPDRGLYLAPCRHVHTFGMRFAIDLVFIDRVGRIVRVVHNVRPWRTAGARDAHGVIELAAGAARRLALVAGERVLLEPNVSMSTQTQETVA